MNISCYGDGLETLVALAPEVDVANVAEFQAAQWRRIAALLGIAAEMEAGLRASLLSGGQLGSVTNVAIAAITKHLRIQAKEKAPVGLAVARHTAISDVAAKTGGWSFDIDLADLSDAGCVAGIRAFPAVNRATYFHPERSAELTPRDCKWVTNYPIFVGTWPWLYGHALHSHPSTLRWRITGDADPIALCARLHASAWSLAGNAGIDARTVYKQFSRCRKSMSGLVASVAKEPSKPGSLYLSESGLIRKYMGTPTHEHLNGALGPVAVVAYNHILHSVAAFFRLRSAIMTHHKTLPTQVQTLLDQSTDPCVQNLRKPQPKPVITL
ncbi:MAG: hypothetical protein ACPG4T_15730 [Nannocystaceae bacterium]